MSDNKRIENMTIKQAVEEHEKKLEKKKQQEIKNRKAMAEKNMKAKPSEIEKSSYTLQEEIAKQVRAVMTDGESMKDTQPTATVPKIKRQGAVQTETRQNTTGQSETVKTSLKPDNINKQVSQDTRNMASDAQHIREQIAKKREVSRVSQGSVPVRSEVDDWLERKQKMLKKRNGGENSSPVISDGMPEEIEGDKKLRFIWNFGEIGKWFQSLCWMHIPLLGMLYIIKLAISKKTPTQKRYFAIAWIMYKLLVWILALTILYIIYKIGLDFVDGMMSYIK